MRYKVKNACISGILIILLMQVFSQNLLAREIDLAIAQKPKFVKFDRANFSFHYSTLEQIQNQALAITVKVKSGQTWGSGVLIQRQGELYTVVTNRHVLTSTDPPYLIETPDGLKHEADIPTNDPHFPAGKTDPLGKNDLAFLHFFSDQIYPIATLRTSHSLTTGEQVFSAGFPFGKKGFFITDGFISLFTPQALEQGYQIGYTNDVEKGMSGGPLLNCYGEVVGINGMHAYPFWGDPYVYENGSFPPQELREQMVTLSFAIPIDNVAKLAVRFPSVKVKIEEK